MAGPGFIRVPAIDARDVVENIGVEPPTTLKLRRTSPTTPRLRRARE